MTNENPNTNSEQNLTQSNQSTFSAVSEQPSKFDLFSGKHTTALIVGTLYIVTLIAFIIFICLNANKNLPIEMIITGFFTIMSGLIGFFAGTTYKRDK